MCKLTQALVKNIYFTPGVIFHIKIKFVKPPFSQLDKPHKKQTAAVLRMAGCTYTTIMSRVARFQLERAACSVGPQSSSKLDLVGLLVGA